MPSCKETARQLAAGELEGAPWPRRLLARVHLLMCRHCRRFARQLGMIAQALRTTWEVEPGAEALEVAKRRILARLAQ